ncbi:hypothetical protein K4L44_07570 [Halosquirtibacter laminarini]|uniref:Uncharacterized protein n=1 Tax=Halosquirtibacter laminarini TaxID=3374600 RepID=A0AC61NIW7_9BACT|nr:hypothetical protein K4L44_07570 [Prolixibacteraceae bacterium]
MKEKESMQVLCLGLATVDIQYSLDMMPSRNEKVKVSPPLLSIGGPATNAAILASVLGDSVMLHTAFGQNGFTPIFSEEMKRYNISCVDWIRSVPANPIIASVFTHSDNGDRAIISSIPSSDFQGSRAQYACGSMDAILVDGFYIPYSISVLSKLNNNDTYVIFDGGSWKEGLNALLKWVNIAVCSSDFYPPNCSSTKDVCDYLWTFPNIENIVITNGSNPIQWFSRSEYGLIEVKRLEAVDTLGAGDFFHGALLYYITKKPFIEALKCAADVASLSCQFYGTRTWFNKIEK